MKTTYILGIITLAELYFTKDIDASLVLWLSYGFYKAYFAH